MFADFQRKFRQRLGDVLIAGTIWVTDRVSTTLFQVLSDATLAALISLTRDSSNNLLLTVVAPVRVTSSIQFEDAGGYISRTAASGVMSFSANGGSISMQLIAGSSVQLGVPGNTTYGITLLDSSTGGTQGTATISGASRGGNTGGGHIVRVLGGSGSTATTGSVGGRLDLSGGAAFGTAANAGGDVRIAGGAPSSGGARGVVALGYDGTNACRVTVRNTILALNGFTSSAAAATTTELATSGDFGLHKNTSTGVVSLCFNDGGTIKSVMLA